MFDSCILCTFIVDHLHLTNLLRNQQNGKNISNVFIFWFTHMNKSRQRKKHPASQIFSATNLVHLRVTRIKLLQFLSPKPILWCHLLLAILLHTQGGKNIKVLKISSLRGIWNRYNSVLVRLYFSLKHFLCNYFRHVSGTMSSELFGTTL